VAVKVTEVPALEHIEVDDATILTVGVSNGFTFMVTALLVAGLPVAQVALEVITTVTTALSANVVVVNVGLLVPAFAPFTFH